MKDKRLFGSAAAAALVIVLVAGLAAAQAPLAAPLGTGFTYQGQLKQDGQPVDALCDFQFSLWDASEGGLPVGSPQSPPPVGVAGGTFTVQLDFGAGAFQGDARWLQVAVCCPAGCDPKVTLAPRQRLTASPYALALPGLWTQPNATSPNVIGGYSGNWVTDGVYGATIGGGGIQSNPNRVGSHGGTVSGGAGNRAGRSGGPIENGTFATVSGGWDNTADGDRTTVAGGFSNDAVGNYATVGGGRDNEARGDASTVPGGQGNLAQGDASTVPGGQSNLAQGDWSFAAGRRAKALHDGAFVWADSTFADFSSTAANQFAVRATGGISLTVDAAGGGLRIRPSAESPNLIGGYSGNWVTSGVLGAAIGGGGDTGSPNSVTDSGGTVGGGAGNQTGDNAYGVDSARWATVGGGEYNTASGFATTIGGGTGNTAGPGIYATVPGGALNMASGQYSFAAGRQAKALHDGSFVWADSTGKDFSSTAVNQFAVRATYGVKIVRELDAFSLTHAALQVDYGGTSGQAAWFYNANANNDWAVLTLLKQPAPSGADADFVEGLEFTGSGGATRKFHIDKTGAYVAGSDFAEALPVAGDPAGYQPGDVLVVSLDRPGGVERCRRPYDGRVLGVYSTRPGFLGADKGGATEVLAGEVPVAVLGIVPVKVSAENGPIQPGDLLTTSSTPGHAMRCEGLERCFGRTLGKALEALPAGQSVGVIRMLVTLQ
jgi:trimeric autotransporter adhesin